MSKRKSLQELTITDNFMFGAVMLDSENCKRLLERALDISIEHVEVIKEKSLVYHPEYKGVRLDVLAADPHNRRFNVEMQVKTTPIEKRSRYYHSQIDMELLESGLNYKELPNSFVIFLCDYDPFGKRKYRYTFRQTCQEDPNVDIDDGIYTIILSNRGQNRSDVSKELADFLDYTRENKIIKRIQSNDSFVNRIEGSIQKIKASREMGARYMTLQELLEDEREEGREEGLAFMAKKLYSRGNSVETIAELEEVAVEQVLLWIQD